MSSGSFKKSSYLDMDYRRTLRQSGESSMAQHQQQQQQNMMSNSRSDTPIVFTRVSSSVLQYAPSADVGLGSGDQEPRKAPTPSMMRKPYSGGMLPHRFSLIGSNASPFSAALTENEMKWLNIGQVIVEHQNRILDLEEEEANGEFSTSLERADLLDELVQQYDLTPKATRRLFYIFKSKYDSNGDDVLDVNEYRRGLPSILPAGAELNDESFKSLLELLKEKDSEQIKSLTYEQFDWTIRSIKLALLSTPEFRLLDLGQQVGGLPTGVVPMGTANFGLIQINRDWVMWDFPPMRNNAAKIRWEQQFFFDDLVEKVTPPDPQQPFQNYYNDAYLSSKKVLDWVVTYSPRTLRSVLKLAIKYRIPPLAVEDLLYLEEQKPKVERYPGRLFFIVLRLVRLRSHTAKEAESAFRKFRSAVGGAQAGKKQSYWPTSFSGKGRGGGRGASESNAFPPEEGSSPRGRDATRGFRSSGKRSEFIDIFSNENQNAASIREGLIDPETAEPSLRLNTSGDGAWSSTYTTAQENTNVRTKTNDEDDDDDESDDGDLSGFCCCCIPRRIFGCCRCRRCCRKKALKVYSSNGNDELEGKRSSDGKDSPPMRSDSSHAKVDENAPHSILSSDRVIERANRLAMIDMKIESANLGIFIRDDENVMITAHGQWSTAHALYGDADDNSTPNAKDENSPIGLGMRSGSHGDLFTLDTAVSDSDPRASPVNTIHTTAKIESSVLSAFREQQRQQDAEASNAAAAAVTSAAVDPQVMFTVEDLKESPSGKFRPPKVTNIKKLEDSLHRILKGTIFDGDIAKNVKSERSRLRQYADSSWLLYEILDGTVDQLRPVVDTFRFKLLALQHILRYRLSRFSRKHVQEVAKTKGDIGELLSYIRPMLVVVSHIRKDPILSSLNPDYNTLGEDFQDLGGGSGDVEAQRVVDISLFLGDVLEHLTDAVGELDQLAQNCSDILIEYRDVRDSRTNEALSYLTLLTAVFVPSQFMTSLFGMNFTKMPLIDLEWYGYFAFWALLLLITSMTILLFSRMEFLPPPRNR